MSSRLELEFMCYDFDLEVPPVEHGARGRHKKVQESKEN